jgi:hypothetical protein
MWRACLSTRWSAPSQAADPDSRNDFDAMVGILLITHAPLGKAFIEAATHVFRGAPEHLESLDVVADQDPEEVRRLAREAIARMDDGAGVLVLTDIIGATPCNCTLAFCVPGKVEVVAATIRWTASRKWRSPADSGACAGWRSRRAEHIASLVRQHNTTMTSNTRT